LDERDSIAYPDAKETNDGSIYITYDRERGGFLHSIDEVYACAREILTARITEEDIIAGKIVTPHSVTKRLVTRYGMPPRIDTYSEELNRVTPDMLSASPELKTAYDNAVAERSLENYYNLCSEYDKFTSKKPV
jgi:hypothetical protein